MRGEDDHLPASSVKVKNEYSHTPTPPNAFTAHAGATLLSFQYTEIRSQGTLKQFPSTDFVKKIRCSMND